MHFGAPDEQKNPLNSLQYHGFAPADQQPCLELVAHIVLLLLVPGEDPDLPDVRIQETVQNGVAEGPGAAGDHQNFIRKNAHNTFSFSPARSCGMPHAIGKVKK